MVSVELLPAEVVVSESKEGVKGVFSRLNEEFILEFSQVWVFLLIANKTLSKSLACVVVFCSEKLRAFTTFFHLPLSKKVLPLCKDSHGLVS